MVPYTLCYTVYGAYTFNAVHSCQCMCERALYKLLSKSGSFNEAFCCCWFTVCFICSFSLPFFYSTICLRFGSHNGMHSFIHCASIALNGSLIPFASSLGPSTFRMRTSPHAHDNRFVCIAYSLAVCVCACVLY